MDTSPLAPADLWYSALPDRALVRVTGADRVKFLQGLLTNDVTAVTDTQAQYTLLLTPQGRFLHDIFVFTDGESLLLDVEEARVEDFIARLSRFRLRAEMQLADECGAWTLYAAFGQDARHTLGLPDTPGAAWGFAGGHIFLDPRAPQLGVRVWLRMGFNAHGWLKGHEFAPVKREEYEQRRYRAGVPDGSRDMVPEQTLPLEANLDRLNAISFTKGCYMGQELTARMHYRALLKKRYVPVTFDGPPPPPGSEITDASGKVVGEIRGGVDGIGLALLPIAEQTVDLFCNARQLQIFSRTAVA